MKSSKLSEVFATKKHIEEEDDIMILKITSPKQQLPPIFLDPVSTVILKDDAGDLLKLKRKGKYLHLKILRDDSSNEEVMT